MIEVINIIKDFDFSEVYKSLNDFTGELVYIKKYHIGKIENRFSISKILDVNLNRVQFHIDIHSNIRYIKYYLKSDDNSYEILVKENTADFYNTYSEVQKLLAPKLELIFSDMNSGEYTIKHDNKVYGYKNITIIYGSILIMLIGLMIVI